MFANTITLSLGERDVTLNRVNQDAYGSEYKFAGELDEMTFKIRHSAESAKGQIPVSRHNVFIEHTVYATPTAHEKYSSVTFTIRDRRGSGVVMPVNLANAVTAKLFADSGEWVSDLVSGVN